MLNNRFFVLGIIASAFVLLFFVFLVKLQIVQQFQFAKTVDNLTTKKNVLNSLRGRIFDANYDEPIVYNITNYKIFVRPSKFPVKDRKTKVKELAEIFNINENRIYKALMRNSLDSSRVLLDRLNYQELTKFLEYISNYQGIEWERENKRYYPLEESMSHVLGYVGDISVSELQALQHKKYVPDDVIGKSGIEKQYEDELRGSTGVIKRGVDVFGQSVDNTQEVLQTAEPGHDLVLTIDKNIQDVVEKSLGNRIGAAVVMRPNGEVLAMASYPRVNPNLLVTSVDDKLLSQIQSNSSSPFLNRAIQASAPPASSFKVIMGTGFLQDNPTLWNHTVLCRGYFRVGNRLFYCWVRTGHGRENFMGALADSCNVFFFSVGINKMGPEIISQYSKMYGLGTVTGIDLPWEVAGTVASPTWKLQRFNTVWQDGDTANNSIGQGFLETTPIQMAQVTAAIINNGVIYQPHVLKEIRDQVTGNVIKKVEPKIVKVMDVDARVFKKVRQAMRGVVTNGTAKPVITTKAATVAAKTGTGQIGGGENKKWHSWFISYAPYNDLPENQVIVVVWVDAVNEWEWWAPKAANFILHSIFTNSTYEETIKHFRSKYLWYTGELPEDNATEEDGGI